MSVHGGSRVSVDMMLAHLAGNSGPVKVLVGQDYDHSVDGTNSKHVIGLPEVLS